MAQALPEGARAASNEEPGVGASWLEHQWELLGVPDFEADPFRAGEFYSDRLKRITQRELLEAVEEELR